MSNIKTVSHECLSTAHKHRYTIKLWASKFNNSELKETHLQLPKVILRLVVLGLRNGLLQCNLLRIFTLSIYIYNKFLFSAYGFFFFFPGTAHLCSITSPKQYQKGPVIASLKFTLQTLQKYKNTPSDFTFLMQESTEDLPPTNALRVRQQLAHPSSRSQATWAGGWIRLCTLDNR